jgi:hypothetical protein
MITITITTTITTTRLRSRMIEEEDEDEDNEPAAPGAETAGVAIKCYYESDIRTINIPRDVPLRDLRMIIAKTYGLKNGDALPSPRSWVIHSFNGGLLRVLTLSAPHMR